MPRKRYYEDYSEYMTAGEFERLMDAINSGVILDSIAFSRQNLNMYKYQPGEVDRLIRTWSGSSYHDPFADCEISISWDMFAQIAHEAAQQTYGVESIDIQGTTIYATIKSNSGRSTWVAEYDFDDNGRITGKFNCHTPYFEAVAPRALGERIQKLIKRAIDN